MKTLKLTIMGQVWTVKYLKRHKMLGTAYGVTIFDKNLVIIKTGLDKGVEDEALMHELFHVSDHYHLSPVDSKLKLTEEQTSRLSSGFYQIVHDNKLNFS